MIEIINDYDLFIQGLITGAVIFGGISSFLLILRRWM